MDSGTHKMKIDSGLVNGAWTKALLLARVIIKSFLAFNESRLIQEDEAIAYWKKILP